jgi:maltose O-acetyltransferase
MRIVTKMLSATNLVYAYVGWRWRRFYWSNLKGARIGSDVYLAPQFKILGDPRNVSIGSGSSVGAATLHAHAPITIGENVVINDHVEIIAGSHDIETPDFRLSAEPVTIGDWAWIATRAVILPGCNIGQRSVVGAAAVVTRSVAPGSVNVGNPAREVAQRRRTDFVYKPFTLHPVSLSRFRRR